MIFRCPNCKGNTCEEVITCINEVKSIEDKSVILAKGKPVSIYRCKNCGYELPVKNATELVQYISEVQLKQILAEEEIVPEEELVGLTVEEAVRANNNLYHCFDEEDEKAYWKLYLIVNPTEYENVLGYFYDILYDEHKIDDKLQRLIDYIKTEC